MGRQKRFPIGFSADSRAILGETKMQNCQKTTLHSSRRGVRCLNCRLWKENLNILRPIKEKAMRAGEAKSILWTEVDTERCLITLNNPEKGSNP